MKNKIIYSEEESKLQNEPMFWSNKDGWGSINAADLFTKAESDQLNLPIGGEWMDYDDAEKMVIDS